MQRHISSVVLKIYDINCCHISVCVLCSNLQPAGAEAKQVQQGSYLQRHTSSVVLKIAQEAATPPLPAVATMVSIAQSHTPFQPNCFQTLVKPYAKIGLLAVPLYSCANVRPHTNIHLHLILCHISIEAGSECPHKRALATHDQKEPNAETNPSSINK